MLVRKIKFKSIKHLEKKWNKEAREIRRSKLINHSIIILSIVFFFGAHLATQFIAGIYTEFAVQEQAATNIIRVAEQSPLLSFLFNSRKIAWSYGTFVVPALLFSFYLLLRKYIKNESLMNYYAITVLFVAIPNFLNDLAVLLGLMINVGMI